jgi:hydrogenase/urease accessory protein HupE
MMAEIVYILCGLTSILCAALLFRQFRSTRTSLLFWSTWCFVCLALTNVLLYVDLVLLPNTDLSVLRSSVTLVGMLMLLYGLIRERT